MTNNQREFRTVLAATMLLVAVIFTVLAFLATFLDPHTEGFSHPLIYIAGGFWIVGVVLLTKIWNA